MKLIPERNTYFVEVIEEKEKDNYQETGSGIIVAKESLSGVPEWPTVKIVTPPKYITIEGKIDNRFTYKEGDKVFIQESSVKSIMVEGEKHHFIEHRYIKGQVDED